MKKEKKVTYTFSCKPSVRKRAMKRADKVGESLSEVIEVLLDRYAELPIEKAVVDKKPVKTVLIFGNEEYEMK
jgi:hypothetical protein